jgi:hypothetical protein
MVAKQSEPGLARIKRFSGLRMQNVQKDVLGYGEKFCKLSKF